jgi:hypothetical protein
VIGPYGADRVKFLTVPGTWKALASGETMERSSRQVVRCHECACWAELNQLDGSCRRHAPNTSDTVDEVAHWPLTHLDDQCGEAIAAQTATRRGVKCNDCVYWRRPSGGLFPYGRRDQLSEWWKQAGRCTRFSPWPSPNPGARAYWRATHETDGCFDGEAKEK